MMDFDYLENDELRKRYLGLQDRNITYRHYLDAKEKLEKSINNGKYGVIKKVKNSDFIDVVRNKTPLTLEEIHNIKKFDKKFEILYIVDMITDKIIKRASKMSIDEVKHRISKLKNKRKENADKKVGFLLRYEVELKTLEDFIEITKSFELIKNLALADPCDVHGDYYMKILELKKLLDSFIRKSEKRPTKADGYKQGSLGFHKATTN